MANIPKSEHKIQSCPTPKKIRAMFNGEVIADSTNVLILSETRFVPIYYFPKVDIRMDLLQNSDHGTTCSKKGEASYWNIALNDKEIEKAAWCYETPIAGAEKIAGYIAFYFKIMDHWYEDDEEIFVHPKDPFVRIGVRKRKQSVRVVIGGETVAQTTQARALYETGSVTRYYNPKEDIRMDFLESTDLHTSCPYKGTCDYWSVKINDVEFENVVWSYPIPHAEASCIENLLCFYNEKVDEVFVEDKPASTSKILWYANVN
jgi:uncharacterized protein (DUF427 family)